MDRTVSPKIKQVKTELITVAHEQMLIDLFETFSRDPDTFVNFHPHPFTSEIASKICSAPGKDLFFACHDGISILSYGMLRYTEPYPDPSLGIAVHPEHRGRGLGRAMMLHLIGAAFQSGAPSITLFVDKSNPARYLYEKCGFSLERSNCNPNELRGTLRRDRTTSLEESQNPDSPERCCN